MESIFRNAELLPDGIAHRVNATTRADFDGILSLALGVPRWIAAIANGRPFADDDAVRRAVFSAAEPFTISEIDDALRVHPRIGERPDGQGEHADRARGEQSGVDVSRSDVREQLRDRNVAYERRFGRVFLIRAAGRDAGDVLATLTDRLSNDPDTELRVVEQQLREIAALRLAAGVNDA